VDPVEVERLTAEAWRCLRDVLETGQVTLASGAVMKPTNGEILRVMEFVARLKPPKRRSVPLPEDYQPIRTQRTASEVSHA
jgi:hypothetical protein